MTLSTLRPTAPSLADIAASPQDDETLLKTIPGIGARRGPLGLLLRPTARLAHKRVARTIVNELKAGYRANDAQAKGLLKLVLAHLQVQGGTRISTLGDVRLAQRFVQDKLLTVGFENGADSTALADRLDRTFFGGLAGLREMLAPLVAALGTDLKVEITEGGFENTGALTVQIEGSADPNDRRFLCEFAIKEDRGVVNLNVLTVGEALMGGAYAKLVLKTLVELMVRSRNGCLSALQLQANINIGTYAWAKAFHPLDRQQLGNVMRASILGFKKYRNELKQAMRAADFASLEQQIVQFEECLITGKLENYHFDILRNIKLPVNMRKAETLRSDATLKDVKEAVQQKKMAAGKLLMVLSSYRGGAWYGEARVGEPSWQDLLLYLYPNAPGPRNL